MHAACAVGYLPRYETDCSQVARMTRNDIPGVFIRNHEMWSLDQPNNNRLDKLQLHKEQSILPTNPSCGNTINHPKMAAHVQQKNRQSHRGPTSSH